MDAQDLIDDLWNTAICQRPETFALLQRAENPLTFAAGADPDDVSAAQLAKRNNEVYPVLVWLRVETPGGAEQGIFLAGEKNLATAARANLVKYGSGLDVAVVLPPGQELWVAVSAADSVTMQVVSIPLTGRRVLGDKRVPGSGNGGGKRGC